MSKNSPMSKISLLTKYNFCFHQYSILKYCWKRPSSYLILFVHNLNKPLALIDWNSFQSCFVVLCKLIKNLTRPPQCSLAWQGKCSWLEWWAWQHSQSTGWCIGRHSSIEICSREQKWIATEWRKNVGRSVFGSAEKPRKRSESRKD